MVNKFFIFSILTFTFLLINNSSNAFSLKMDGTWECRLGWSWIKTNVSIDGYFEDNVNGTARISSVDVDEKSFIDYHIRQDKLIDGQKTPYLIYMYDDEKRIFFEFRKSSQFRKYDNDGLVVTIEKIKFSEKEGTKIEKIVRYCKKVY